MKKERKQYSDLRNLYTNNRKSVIVHTYLHLKTSLSDVGNRFPIVSVGI